MLDIRLGVFLGPRGSRMTAKHTRRSEFPRASVRGWPDAIAPTTDWIEPVSSLSGRTCDGTTHVLRCPRPRPQLHYYAAGKGGWGEGEGGG